VIVNATLVNQSVDLMQTLALYQYSDYTVESVVVRSGGNQNATLELVVNGQVEDESQWPSSIVSLYPRYDLRLGSEIQSLSVFVNGEAFVSQIEVRLRRVGYTGDYNQYQLPLDLTNDLYDGDTVQLSDLMDLSQYAGYRVISVEVDAAAYYADNENLSLVVDGDITAQAAVTAENSQVILFPNSTLILGGNANSIALMGTGDGALSLSHVTVRLSRY
jgi:hypothetical protein